MYGNPCISEFKKQVDLSEKQVGQVTLNFPSMSPKKFIFMSNHKNTVSLADQQSLDLSSNEYSDMPEGLGRMLHLKKLDLSKNKIEGWSHLPLQLEELNLSRNRLTEAAKILTKMNKLRSLDLSFNRISMAYPLLLSPSLMYLFMRGNQVGFPHTAGFYQRTRDDKHPHRGRLRRQSGG